MGENTNIEWAHHTFNPWIGCTKVGPGCDHCYAESYAKRTGQPELWQGKRRMTKTWGEPLKWSEEAGRLGIRYRVFCASLADVFDNEVPQEWRDALWELIERTPHLDWLLLTKRVGNVNSMIPDRWKVLVPPNVWIGATMVNQEEFDRDMHKLAAIKAYIRFISFEPLLGEVDIFTQTELLHHVDWGIIGGESGAGARSFVLGHGKRLVRDFNVAGIKPFVKQVGSRPVNREGVRCPNVKHYKGNDMSEWPEELRVREFPAGFKSGRV
jgi:protein gp37